MIRLTNLWKCVIAEFIATTTLLLFGTTTNAQFTLGKGKSGDWLALCFGWAIGLTLSVQLAWRISGSHLNPAVSLFAWSTKQISFKRFLLYSLAQIAGAYCGAGLTFLEYREGIQSVDGGRRMVFGENGTAGIFTTFPQNYVSITGGYIDQILGTTILVFFIGSICDKRNAIPEFLKPVFIGGLLTLIGICLEFLFYFRKTISGMNTGYAINPARDLGPRLFLWTVGYGEDLFKSLNHWYWLIPVLGPLIGAMLGGWLYKGFQLLSVEDERPKVESKIDENTKKIETEEKYWA